MDRGKSRTPVDLIVLCGFLGSGKTSLLVDHLHRNTRGDTGVIINEVGEIGIDGAIVANDGSDIAVTTLANGCLCCSLRSSLVDTVMALLAAPTPAGAAPMNRIIMEANGLSRPGPIIASLAAPELISAGVRAMVVSTYDCVSGIPGAETFEDAAAQIAAAQRVVFTKVDKVPLAEMERHRRVVTGVNPFAEIIADADRGRTVEAAFGAMRAGDPVTDAVNALSAMAHGGLEHPRVHVLKGTAVRRLAWEDVASWLDELSGLCGGRLLRLKATIHVSDCDDPIWIQSVGTAFSAPRRVKERQCRDAFVVIVRDMSVDEITAGLGSAPIALTEHVAGGSVRVDALSRALAV